MTERLYHDIMCPSLTKQGPCNCVPVVVADGNEQPSGVREDPGAPRTVNAPNAPHLSRDSTPAVLVGQPSVPQQEPLIKALIEELKRRAGKGCTFTDDGNCINSWPETVPNWCLGCLLLKTATTLQARSESGIVALIQQLLVLEETARDGDGTVRVSKELIKDMRRRLASLVGSGQ